MEDNNYTEELNKEIEKIEGIDILLGKDKIEKLWLIAKNMSATNPEKALRFLTTVAFKTEAFPSEWYQWKLNILREIISMIDKLEGKDFIWAYTFANLCRTEGKSLAAAHNYIKAAEAYNREGIGFIKLTPPERDWHFEFRILRDASVCFQEGGDPTKASEYYIKSMRLKLKHAQKWAWFRMQIGWHIWGWGEKPLKVIVSGFSVILMFALVYQFTGIHSETKGYLGGLIDSIYFSIITFTTLGYGDIIPSSNISKLLAASEALCGIFFTGLFLVTFVKRYTR